MRRLHPAQRHSARHRRAGFTLVELMVALTIAAVVIATIYTLVGSSARNFHEQQRVGQTQLSTRLALDRLRRDIERAGLHGTPNSRLERQFGAAVAPFAAVQLADTNSASRAALDTMQGGPANTTVQADVLTLTGNYTTSDAFLVRMLNGAGNAAELQVTWQGFRRAFANYNDATGATFDAAVFREVFAVGRLLHLTMVNGNHYFVTVTGATLTGAGPTTIAQVAFNPPLPVGGLGVGGLGEGATIAPLTQVQYRIAAIPDDAVGPTRGDPAVTGINTGLVRTETNVLTTAQINPPRTILEWAVHFDVDAIVDTAIRPAIPAPAFVADAAAATAITNRPESVRALIVEIGARTPDQDPSLPWVAPTATADLAMFRVFTNRPGAARVRTGRLEISLPNLVYRGL